MPATNSRLLTFALGQHPRDAGVADCWGFVARGIELGWLDRDDLHELVGFLRERRDWSTEELLFSNLGDDLRVSFLDDEALCDPERLANEIGRLLESFETSAT
jgi:hypothetical protein